jgi:hypothetical protein
LTHNRTAMERAENGLRRVRSDSRVDEDAEQVLRAISKSLGRDVDDVSRVQIMLDPTSAREWTHLSRGEDAVAQLALKLAQRDQTMDTEDLSKAYEKSGALGDLQSGILLSPWRFEGWQKLRLSRK